MMLTLTRQVRVEAFVAVAEIGVPSEREEILAVLKLATELGGYVKADDVNTWLLGRPAGSPHGQRIMMLMEAYGLLEKIESRESDSYGMTEAGRENLQKGQIMVPEEGSYILFVTTDPLFKEAILRIDRTPFVEEKEAQTYFGRSARSSTEQIGETVERPEHLDKYEHGYVFRQVAKSNATVQVNSISERVALSSRQLNVKVALELELNADAKMKVWTANGPSSSPEVYAETKFDRRCTEVLESLTAHAGRLEMLEGEPTLLVGWSGVNSSEAERFRKEIKVERPTLGEFASFDGLSFTLPILPATQQDAVVWANCLLRNSIKTYVDELGYLSKLNEVAARFGKKYDPSSLKRNLTEFEDMVHQVVEERRAGETSELYWYLIVPRDLSIR